MSITDRAVFLAVSAIAMASAPALAFFGAPGCTNLPLYNRALGALQGMTSACDMTIDEARRIIAAEGNPAAVRQSAPSPRAPLRRHRAREMPR